MVKGDGNGRTTRDLNVRIGAAIRRRRRQGGYTLEVLAHRARCSMNHLSVVERGIKSPTLDFLERIARALDVSVADFFSAVGSGSGIHEHLLGIEEDFKTLGEKVSALRKQFVKGRPS